MGVTSEEMRAVITADPSGFVRGQEAVRRELTNTQQHTLRATQGHKAGMDLAAGATKQAENAVLRLGAAMAVAFSARAVVGGIVQLVGLASDLEEATNRLNVVLGESGAAVTSWGEANATAYGLTRGEAIAAAGGFAALFDSMKLGDELSSQMSATLTALAGDLASFNNIDPTVALEKLRAGLVGETEPLRALGVNLSATTVEMKALEMGIISAGEEMDAATKAQAAFALILEQTSSAQGDFARTSDALANSQRIANAELRDGATALGEMLLPAATDAAHMFADVVPGAMAFSIAALGSLLGVTDQYVSDSANMYANYEAALVAGEAAAAAARNEINNQLLATMLTNDETFLRAKFANDTNAMRAVIAMNALGVGAIEAITNEHFTTSLMNATLYQETLTNYIFRKGWENAANAVGESAVHMHNVVNSAYAAIIDSGVQLVQKSVELIGGMFPELFAKLKAFVAALPAPIQALIGGFGDGIKKAIDVATLPFRLAIAGALTAADVLRKGASSVFEAFSLAGEAFQVTRQAAFGTSAAAVSFDPADFAFQSGGFTKPSDAKAKAAPKPKAASDGAGGRTKEEDAALIAARLAEATSSAIIAGLDALRQLSEEPLPPETEWRARLDALVVFLDASNQAFEGLLIDQFERFGQKLERGAKAFIKGPMSALEPFAQAVEQGARALSAAASAGADINNAEAILLPRLAIAEANASLISDALWRLSGAFRAADQVARDELVKAVTDYQTYTGVAADVLATAAAVDLRGVTSQRAADVAATEANAQLLQDSLWRVSGNFRAASEAARTVLLSASQDYVTYVGLSREALEIAAGLDLSDRVLVTREQARAAADASGELVDAVYLAAQNFIIAATDDSRGLAALVGGVQAWNTYMQAAAGGLTVASSLDLSKRIELTSDQLRAAASQADMLIDVTWETAQNFIIAASDDARGLAALVSGVQAWGTVLSAAGGALQTTADAAKVVSTYTGLNIDAVRVIASDSVLLLAEVETASAAWRKTEAATRGELTKSLSDYEDAVSAAAGVIDDVAGLLDIPTLERVLRRSVVDTWAVLAAYSVLLLAEVETASAGWRDAAAAARTATADGLGDYSDAAGAAAGVVSTMADLMDVPTIDRVLRRSVVDTWAILAAYSVMVLAEVESASAGWRQAADETRNATADSLGDFQKAQAAAVRVVKEMSDLMDAPALERVLRRSVVDTWHILAVYATLLVAEVEAASRGWRSAADEVRDATSGGLADFASATSAAASVVESAAGLLDLPVLERVLKRSLIDTWHILAVNAKLMAQEVSAVAATAGEFDQKQLDAFADAVSATSSALADAADAMRAGEGLNVPNPAAVVQRMKEAAALFLAAGKELAETVRADDAEIRASVAESAGRIAGGFSDLLSTMFEAVDSPFGKVRAGGQRGDTLRENIRARIVASMKAAASALSEAATELNTIPTIEASVVENVNAIAAAYRGVLGIVQDAQSALGKEGGLEAVRRLAQVPLILANGLQIGGNLAGGTGVDARPDNGGLAVNVNLSPTFLPINITTNVTTNVQVGPTEMGRWYDKFEEYRQERLNAESGR